jgi:hypothetical protein
MVKRNIAIIEPKPLRSGDRRRHQRRLFEQPCKVYQPATGRYVQARTIDLSAGGALVEVDLARSVDAGEEMDLAMTWLSPGLLAGDSMIRSRVVRCTPSPMGRHVLALEFSRAALQPLVEAA